MTGLASDAVVQEVRIAARPETVFAFLVDPARLVQWKGIEADLDPRPGGLYRCLVNPRSTARGEFLEVVPPRRVVFTWGWEEPGLALPPGSSRIEIDLFPDGDGTLVRLTHSGLAEAEMRRSHAEGWQHYLARLAVAAEGRDPGPDPWATPAQPQG
jgi:uncharacterized protein YndB with AHSA1/START domain